MSPKGSVEHPLYKKLKVDDGAATNYYFITVDEGWRSSILCDNMYSWVADWLIEQLQGKPFVLEFKL